MNVSMGLARVLRLLAAIGIASAAWQAHAAGNWEVGKVLHTSNGCTDCHARKDGASISDITNAIATVTDMTNRFSAGGTTPLSPDQISDISAYLNHLNFPLASLNPTSFSFSPVSVDLSATHAFRVTNSGDIDLLVTGASVSGGNGYSVDASNCTAAPVSPTAPNNHCDVIVTFQPPTATTFNNRTLTINFSNTFSNAAVATPINGTGLAQFTVSTNLLEFTAVTAPSGVLQLVVVDNKGDRIRMCRADASTFNFPGDFSLDAPFTLGVDGCFTTTTTATLPRILNVPVHFVAGDVGPRNGALTLQRVDAGGTGIGSVATVQLHGNPGPLATVDASTLFDQAGDPGVEVDNDNVLDRGVTLFSQGSDPLVFAGSTFTISGASASEYSLPAGGCVSLAGLPAGTTNPPPSCVLTVRFNPAGLGVRPAVLRIQIAGAIDRMIPLNGTGIFGPRLEVSQVGGPLASGSALNFGAQTIGGLYASRTLTLRNGGTLGDLEVVVPPSASTPGFTLTPDAGCANLAPAAQCALALHFDPTQVQAYAANLVIQSRPAGSAAAYTNFSLTLNGQGTTGALPTLVWTDTTGTPITAWAFGTVDVGSPVTATVRLRNDGPGGVVLGFVNAVGAGGSSYIVDASACGTLFETMSCAITVQFAPGSAGAKAAVLQGVTAAGSPSVGVLAPDFVLSGTGRGSPAPGALTLSATALSFQAVDASQSLPLDVTVTNTSANPVQVLGYDVTAGYSVAQKSCPAAPFMLAAGSQCTLSVTFHPLSAGPTDGMLRISAEGQATTLDVALNGNATPQADVSSGGCSLAAGDPRFDPALWLLTLLAAAALWWRRRPRPAPHPEASPDPRHEPSR
jgi:hypothetical protein